jgi:hypothetical protein
MTNKQKKEKLSELDPRVTGSIGGKTRARNLSAERRQEIARKASLAAQKARERNQQQAEAQEE